MIEEGAMDQRQSLTDIALAARTQYRTVEEMTFSAIREAIVSGVIPPGAKLHQGKLAEALDVSRFPVRSALRRLEAEGLVAIFPHRGAMVKALAADEIRELYELRILLETFALGQAMRRITPDEVDELEDIARRLDSEPEGDQWVDLRSDFYARLYGAAGRPRTLGMIEALRADIGRFWLGLRVVHHTTALHQDLVRAIRAGEEGAAEAWLRQHLESVCNELTRLARLESDAIRRDGGGESE